MDEALKWVEEHPAISAVIGVGGAIVLLYLFGVFGSSSSNAQTGQSNLAAAYYAAEAMQTQAGTQLNIAQANDQAATAQTQIQANAATAIQASQANMVTTLGNQQLQGNQTLYNDQMITAQTQYNDAVQTAANANYYAYQTNQSNLQASQFNNYVNTVLPTELALTGGSAAFDFTGVAGPQSLRMAGSSFTPNAMAAAGYTPAEIQAAFG